MKLLLSVSAVATLGLALLAGPTASAEARTHIMCLNNAGSRYVAEYRPEKCAHYGNNGSFGGGVFLKSMEWENWGDSRAQGEGKDCGFHVPCADVHVDVVLRREREACGRRVYTRLKATSQHGTTRIRLERCPGPA